MWKTVSLLVFCVGVLMTVGFVMLASTSYDYAQSEFGDPTHFVKRQAFWLALGCIAIGVVSRVPYELWKQFSIPLLLLSVLLLILVFVPGIGHGTKGSHRWIRFAGLGFQPSELAKFSTLVFLAWWLSRHRRYVETFKTGMLVPMCCLGVVLLLIFIEPDFGTTMLVAAVGMIVMFLGGVRISYLTVAGLLGSVGLAIAILHSPERLRRILAFLNPEKYARTEGHQLLNALYAYVEGGSIGAGLGQGLQKKFYLPEAHTDFIFAIIGEELGFPGTFAILLLYFGLFLCGLLIAVNARDSFGRLLALGITFMIVLQALINIGVVTGSLPTKGLALPFVSFGGSSLVMSAVMIGVLINIAAHADPDAY